MTDCSHWCRGNGNGGHDWSHEIKDGGVALDSFRLFCPEHGAQIVKSILDGPDVGTATEGGSPGGPRNGPQEHPSLSPEAPEGGETERDTWGTEDSFHLSFPALSQYRDSWIVRQMAHDEEIEDLSSMY
jgi:hypothetical protein